MKTSTPIHPMLKPKRQRLFLCSFISTLLFLSAAFFIGSAFVIKDYKERFLEWEFVGAMLKTRSKMCETTHRPHGTEALPKGIVSTTSDLEMRSLWGPRNKKNSRSTTNLLAMAVGIKQKESVDKIVKKFLSSNFVVMLFHYDGIVNEWRDLKWSDNAIHVSAVNQTKWWFAKRFLHPDIIFEYAYIFLWDEDLGVEYFDIERYLSIVKEEGLEISQPAVDPDKSEVHHDLTSRDNKSNIHRRIHKVLRGGRKCDNNSTDPPCTGWVEMMAPAFSKASWRCVWHMIQGDRTKKIGIVDSVYIIHYGLPTLGGSAENKTLAETPNQASQTLTSENREQVTASHQSDGRAAVRRQSFILLEIFKNRWKKAVRDDNCWTDPFQQQQQQSKI